MYINKDNTSIIGAGEWYTELFFSAPSDNAATYHQRGIEVSGSNTRIEGLYLNTINNQRYYQGNSSYQVGKAFMGAWGKNSVIRHCWAEHFECGAWIADYSSVGSENLLVEHCRFRNNYADGINCSHGSNGHTIRYCSFRNNGDDDMASWTTSRMCKHVTFEYCTAENNWRASSLGFFGGTGHTAHHLAIFDGLESGARVNADFDGRGFSTTENILLHNITIVHCGCTQGVKGVSGDFWGNRQGAFNIGGTSRYDVRNVHLDSITILDSRDNAVSVIGGAHSVTGFSIRNTYIRNAVCGIAFSAAKGDGTWCNILFDNVSRPVGAYNSQWAWTESGDCATALPLAPDMPEGDARIYDLMGRPCGTIQQDFSTLRQGVYVVCSTRGTYKIVVP